MAVLINEDSKEELEWCAATFYASKKLPRAHTHVHMYLLNNQT